MVKEMKHAPCLLGVILCLLWAGDGKAQSFRLGFDCPPHPITGAPGEKVILDVYVTLFSDVPTEMGAMGWQLGVAVEGPARIRYRDKDGHLAPDAGDDHLSDAKYCTRSIPGFPLEIDTRYDDDDDPDTPPLDETIGLEEVGFNVVHDAELPDSDPPLKGILTGIVLQDLIVPKARTLLPVGTQRLMRITLEVTIPGEPSRVALKFQEGLIYRPGAQPLPNLISYLEQPVYPGDDLALQECIILTSPLFGLAIVPPGEDPNATTPLGDSQYPPILVPSGQPSIHELDVILTSWGVTSEVGPEGWQISIAYDPEACNARMLFYDSPDPERAIPENVSDQLKYAKNMTRGFNVTTAFDHDGNPSTPPMEEVLDLADAGFNHTSSASGDYQDSPVPPGLNGMVSAVVLTELGSLAARALSANSRNTIMKILIEMPAVEQDEIAECRIYFQDFMKGAGQPVKNVLTYYSGSADPGNLQGIVFTVAATGPEPPFQFLRGDANDDGKFDIADAIRIIRDPRVVPGLGGNAIPCTDAGDVNDDEILSLADAVYLISWQFQLQEGFPPPPHPFPDCGMDDDLSVESCPPGSVSQCAW